MRLLLFSRADANIVSMTDAQWASTVCPGPSHLEQTVALQCDSDNELQGLTGSALRTVLRPEGLLLLWQCKQTFTQVSYMSYTHQMVV